MTKAVRIENADTHTGFKLLVDVWERCTDKPPELVETLPLPHPTNLLETYVTSTRYLVIREETTLT